LTPDRVLFVDSYTALVEGLDTQAEELDLVEFLGSMPYKHVVGVNRDLMGPVAREFLRTLKDGFDWVFSVDRN
jgi:hypothetical protein